MLPLQWDRKPTKMTNRSLATSGLSINPRGAGGPINVWQAKPAAAADVRRVVRCWEFVPPRGDGRWVTSSLEEDHEWPNVSV
jgi:hypothetical protein